MTTVRRLGLFAQALILSRLNVDDDSSAVGPLRASAHRGVRATGKPSGCPVTSFLASGAAHRTGAVHRVKWTQDDLKTSSPPSRLMGCRRPSSRRIRPWNEPWE